MAYVNANALTRLIPSYTRIIGYLPKGIPYPVALRSSYLSMAIIVQVNVSAFHRLVLD
jgi:hypothetical protein